MEKDSFKKLFSGLVSSNENLQIEKNLKKQNKIQNKLNLKNKDLEELSKDRSSKADILQKQESEILNARNELQTLNNSIKEAKQEIKVKEEQAKKNNQLIKNLKKEIILINDDIRDYENTISSIDKSIEGYQSEEKSINRSKRELLDKIDSLKLDREKKETELNYVRESKEQAKSELVNIQENYEEEKSKFLEKSKELDKKNEEFEILKKRLEDVEKETNEMILKSKEIDSEIRVQSNRTLELHSDIQVKKSENKNLILDIENRELELNKLNLNIQNLHSEVEESKFALEKKRINLSNLEVTLASLNIEKNEILKHVEEFGQETSRVEASTQKHNLKILECNKKISELKSQLATIKEEKNSANDELGACQEKESYLNSQISDLEKRVILANKDKVKVESERDSLIKINEEKSNDVKALCRKLDMISNTIAGIEKDIQNENAKIEDSENSIAKLNLKIEVASKKQDSLNAELLGLRKVLADREKENNEKEQILKTIITKTKDLEESINAENNALEKLFEESKATSERIIEAKEKEDDFSRKIKMLKERVSKETDQLSLSLDEVSNLTDSIQTQEQELAKKEEERKRVETKRSEYKSKHEKLLEAYDHNSLKIRQSISKTKSLEISCTDLEKRVFELEENLKKVKNIENSKTQEDRGLVDKIELLEKKIKSLEEEEGKYSHNIAALDQKIAILEKDLVEKNDLIVKSRENVEVITKENLLKTQKVGELELHSAHLDQKVLILKSEYSSHIEKEKKLLQKQKDLMTLCESQSGQINILSQKISNSSSEQDRNNKLLSDLKREYRSLALKIENAIIKTSSDDELIANALPVKNNKPTSVEEIISMLKSDYCDADIVVSNKDCEKVLLEGSEGFFQITKVLSVYTNQINNIIVESGKYSPKIYFEAEISEWDSFHKDDLIDSISSIDTHHNYRVEDIEVSGSVLRGTILILSLSQVSQLVKENGTFKMP